MPGNPIWNFFEKLECDRSRALCKECGNSYSLGSDKPKAQSVTGLKNHLRTHHKDTYTVFIKRVSERDIERSSKRLKRECPEMFELQDFVDYAVQPETEMSSLLESDVPNGHFAGVLRPDCRRVNCYDRHDVACNLSLC